MTKESTLKPIIIDGFSMHVTNVNDLFIQPFQEFVYMEEETNKDNPKPSVEVDMKKANKTPENASTLDKVKAWFAKVWRMFTTWVAKIAQNIKDAFSKNYASQIKYVNSNKELNDKIKESIAKGEFKPTIKDWPTYHIPIKEIIANCENKKLQPIIEKHLNAEEPINPKAIKEEYYPKNENGGSMVVDYSIDEILDSLIQEFGIVLEADENKDKNADKPKSKTEANLRNFFLYGKYNPDHTVTNQLTDGLWEDLVNNIINCEKAITIGITGMQKDIKECSDWINKKFQEVSAQQSSEEGGEGTTNSNPSKITPDLVKSYAELVQTISNEYLVNFANTMQKEFFVKSYNLYRDMVNAYKNTNGQYNTDQPQQTTQTNTQTNPQTETPTSAEQQSV